MTFTAVLLFGNQNKNCRTVMIFTDKVNNANAVQQVNILKSDPKGTKDRDLVFTIVNYNDVSATQYKKWHVPNAPFTVLLIGKDNGEKLRSHQPVTLAKLYDLIDSMPMRQLEVQYKH